MYPVLGAVRQILIGILRAGGAVVPFCVGTHRLFGVHCPLVAVLVAAGHIQREYDIHARDAGIVRTVVVHILEGHREGEVLSAHAFPIGTVDQRIGGENIAVGDGTADNGLVHVQGDVLGGLHNAGGQVRGAGIARVVRDCQILEILNINLISRILHSLGDGQILKDQVFSGDPVGYQLDGIAVFTLDAQNSPDIFQILNFDVFTE